MERRVATVILRHESDAGAKSIAMELANIGRTRILHDYFEVIVSSNQTPDSDVTATFFTGSNAEHCKLLDRLSRLGNIDLIRLVCVDALHTGDDLIVVSDIARAVETIRLSLGQLLGARVRVLEARIGIRGFGEPIPLPTFFPINADANVLVVPHDRISDGGMARPIARGGEQEDSHTFALHGAIEISSLLGLWKSMRHAPVDGFAPTVAGSAISRLRFSQSRVRILIGPPLPMRDLATSDSDLPLPLQHFAVSNVDRAIRDLVGEIYPADLEFHIGTEPDFAREVSGGVSGLVQFIREFGRTVVLLPRIIVKGLKGELDAVASNVYQDVISDETMVRVIGARSSGNVQTIGMTGDDLDKLIKEVASLSDRELVSPLTREHWQSILTRFLGAIDGSPYVRDTRQRLFSNENIVLVGRSAVGICREQLCEQIAYLLGRAEESTKDEREDSGESVGFSSIEGDDPKIDSEAIENIMGRNEVASSSMNANRSESSSSSFSDANEQISEDTAAESMSKRDSQPGDLKPSDLIHEIGRAFTRERVKARAQAESMIQRIHRLADEFRAKDVMTLSTSVSVAAWVSFCAIIFGILTCTPLRRLLSFSSLSGYARDALWASFSGLFVIAAIMLLGYGGKRAWQVRALITSGVTGLCLAIGVLWFDDIRSSVQVERGNYTAAAILGLLTLGLLGIAVFRNLTSPLEVRQQLGRLFLLFGSVYLLISLVLWQCMESSTLQTASATSRAKILLAIVIVAGITLSSCLGVVALLQIRERLRLRANARILEWSRQELVTAIQAERVLAAAHTQWAASGAVLARLLTFPLGKQFEGLAQDSENLSSDESILKYDVAKLELNSQGDSGLIARLRRHFVEPGWLTRQYEKMVRRYQEQAAFASGNRIEDLIERRPEIDPVVILPEQAIHGMARGDRWDFARRVFDGEYDVDLGSIPEQLDLEEVYQSVLDSPSSYSLLGSQLPNATAREFLEQVLPTPGVELATGLTKRVFTAGDDSRKMKSEVWWPSDILGDPPVDSSEVTVNSSSSELSSFFGGSVVLVGIRVDVSEPFAYVDCEGAEDLRLHNFQIDLGESGQSDF